MPSNDTDSGLPDTQSSTPDAHGHAALLLVESLIHGLISRSIIKASDAFDIVESANDVQVEIAEAADGHGASMWRSHALLTSMAESLKHDLDKDTTSSQPIP
jgi:hypothetical protein